MNYTEELLELIEEFQAIDDKMERLEMVFDLADEVTYYPQTNGLTQHELTDVVWNPCKGGSIRFKC